MRSGGATDEKISGRAIGSSSGAMDEKRSCETMRRELVGPWMRRKVVGSWVRRELAGSRVRREVVGP